MTHFPLNTAVLCQDCSEVGDSTCGVALAVGRVLSSRWRPCSTAKLRWGLTNWSGRCGA